MDKTAVVLKSEFPRNIIYTAYQRFLNISLLFSNSATGSFTVESETRRIMLDAHKAETKNEISQKI